MDTSLDTAKVIVYVYFSAASIYLKIASTCHTFYHPFFFHCVAFYARVYATLFHETQRYICMVH